MKNLNDYTNYLRCPKRIICIKDVFKQTSSISLGENTVLDFDGGSISADQPVNLIGDKTKIANITLANHSLRENINLTGKWYNFGNLIDAPTDVKIKGTSYFCTDLNIPIYWDGIKWIESDGAVAGVNRYGVTADRPDGSYIYVGFVYMDTDLGKPIYASAISGDTVTWVDATGTTV